MIANIPNFLSFVRLFSVIPLFFLIKFDFNLIAFIVFILAAISDFFDGFLARKWNVSSRLGAILDPLADKVLMTFCYGIFSFLGELPIWCSSVVIGRDIAILFIVAFLMKTKKCLKIKPLFISKLNTAFQLILVMIVLFLKVIGLESLALVNFLSIIVTGTTLLSGLAYLVKMRNFY